MRAGPLPGDGEQGSDQLPPVGFGIHVHAEVHGSLEELKFKLLHLLGLLSVTESEIQVVCRHLVYEVSVDAVGELLDEGVHDQLQV